MGKKKRGEVKSKLEEDDVTDIGYGSGVNPYAHVPPDSACGG